MRDEERITMYYKFRSLDWKSEQQLEYTKKKKSRQPLLYSCLRFAESLLSRIRNFGIVISNKK